MNKLMKYRRFGRTNLSIPVISCGGMRYQHSWKDEEAAGITPEGQANLEATIHRALELGINHIETARGYGTSELQLGRILPRLPREQMIVQTKVSPCADPKEFLATFNKSMNNLQLDYVDFLGVHGINNEELLDFTLRRGGCLEVARQLQKEGRVRFIGFSTHAVPRVIVRAIESGEFDYVNLHWYFVNPLNWSAVEAATKRDMGVFIISPNDKGGMLQNRPAKMAQVVRSAFADALQRSLLSRAAGGAHAELRRGPPERFRRTHRSAEVLRSRRRNDRAHRAPFARRDGTRAGRGLVCALAGGLAGVFRSAGQREHHRNPPAVDVCEVTRSRRVGQDALQLAERQWRPLVPRRNGQQNQRRPKTSRGHREEVRSPNASRKSCAKPTNFSSTNPRSGSVRVDPNGKKLCRTLPGRWWYPHSLRESRSRPG